MAACKNTKVTFKVTCDANFAELYVCGNVAQLGEWTPAKAVKLVYNEETKCYEASKMLPVDSHVEYKVLAAKDWASVECHNDGNEAANHSFVAVKGHVEEVHVACFR